MRSRMPALIEQLGVAVARRAGTDLPGEAGGPPSAAAALGALAALAALRLDYPAADGAEAATSGDPLERIGDVFGLDETDRRLLHAAAAADLDTNVGIVYAGLLGTSGVARCTVAVALELTGTALPSAAAFDRLGPAAPLIRHGLVDVTGTHPWGQRALVVPEPVLAALSGASPADPLLAPMQAVSLPLDLPGHDRIAAAIEAGSHLVWVRSVRGAAGTSLAAAALQTLDVPAVTRNLLRAAPAAGLAQVLAAAVRDAALRGCALILSHAEVLAERGGADAFAVLAGAAVPVICVGSCAWNPAWLARVPLLVEAGRIGVEHRGRLWHAHLGAVTEHDDELRQTLLALRMDPETIEEAARYARTLAASRDEPLSGTIVREAARRVSGSGGAGEAFLAPVSSEVAPTLADLMLPPAAAASVRQLVGWARHRDEVAAHGLVQHTGRGIAALFAGNPGTGKTLAAHVVAQELSMDLYQVELSSVVDKYIGETEKNLERVFQAAEALDVVLFFDEADALFGSRSEVRDAKDRYANQEIAYLLQRMEQFDGITILATNLRGNLDRAFSRRMSFIVTFPDPDASIRRRLWEHHLAQLDVLDAADPVQLDLLAETAEITGGDIRNIVRAAAYDATTAGERVGMRHLSTATLSEYRKLGRVLPEHGFAGTAGADGSPR